jgi:hypothetical protein
MKTLAIALTVAAISLGGCAGELATLQSDISAVTSGISLVTKSVTNPVTTTDLYEIESSISIGFTALKAYKQACADGAADKNCKANVAAIQVYTRQIQPYLTQLRGFVKNNDQIDATTVYNQLVTLYGNAKTTAANLGVNLGS